MTRVAKDAEIKAKTTLPNHRQLIAMAEAGGWNVGSAGTAEGISIDVESLCFSRIVISANWMDI